MGVRVSVAPHRPARPPDGRGPGDPVSAGSPADAAQDDQTGERLPTRGPVTATTGQKVAEPLDLVGGLLRGVPIIDGDFADPYALSERDAIYIYATNTVDANVPVVELPKDDSAAHPGNDSQ